MDSGAFLQVVFRNDISGSELRPCSERTKAAVHLDEMQHVP